MDNTKPQVKKLYALEGVRAIACLGVFAAHFKGAFLPNSFPDWIWNTPLKVLFVGTPFVRVFFVLSGFVVAYKYFTTKKYEDIRKDVPRRYLRLLPMLLLANLATWFCLKFGLCYNVPAAEISGSQSFLGALNAFPANLKICLQEAFIGNFIGTGASYVPPFWTIEYEFLGVLLVLAALAIFRTHKIRWAMYAVFLLVFNGQWNYLIIGLLTADLYVNTPLAKYLCRYQVISTIVLIGLMMLFGISDLYDGNKLWRIGYGALISAITLLLITNKPAEIVFGCKPARFLGRISFGIYSFHWLVIITLGSYLYTRWGGTRKALVTMGLLSLALILVLAFLSTLASEQFTKLLRKCSDKIAARICHRQFP